MNGNQCGVTDDQILELASEVSRGEPSLEDFPREWPRVADWCLGRLESSHRPGNAEVGRTIEHLRECPDCSRKLASELTLSSQLAMAAFDQPAEIDAARFEALQVKTLKRLIAISAETRLQDPPASKRHSALMGPIEGRLSMSSISKKMRMVLAVTVPLVLVVAYVAFFYPWPNESATVGTIGGVQKADRFRADQVTAADVSLKDAQLQVLLQNDQVLKFVRSDAFKQLVNNKDFQQLVSNAQFEQFATEQAVTSQFHFANTEVTQLITNQEFIAACSQNALTGFASEPISNLFYNHDFQQILGQKPFQQLVSNEQFQALFSQIGGQNIAQNPTAQQIANQVGAQAVLSNLIAQEFLNSPGFGQFLGMFSNPAFAQLVNNSNILDLIAGGQIVGLITNQNFGALVSNESFQNLIGNQAFVSQLGSQAIWQFFGNSNVQQAITEQNGVQNFVTSQAFNQLTGFVM